MRFFRDGDAKTADMELEDMVFALNPSRVILAGPVDVAWRDFAQSAADSGGGIVARLRSGYSGNCEFDHGCQRSDPTDCWPHAQEILTCPTS
jgi:hypothetical protein